MTQLNDCLVNKLDNFPEFGDHRLGTSLNQCLTDLLASVGGGSTLILPTYDTTTDYDLDNVTQDGSIFLSDETGTIFYNYSGNWVEIDMGTLQACCNANALSISNINNSINIIQTNLQTLESEASAHTHNGVDSLKISVKDLNTSAATAGDIFTADGAGGVTCGAAPSGSALKLEQPGVTTINDVECIIYDSNYINLGDDGGGQVTVTTLDLEGDIDSLFLHNHASGTLPPVPPLGIDSTGLTTANTHQLCNNGAGRAVWTPKPTGGTTPDYFVEKYEFLPNINFAPTGTQVVVFNQTTDLTNTNGVCSQLQAGNTGCIEILADGVYSLDTFVATTALPVNASSRFLLNIAITGSAAENQNIAAIQSSAVNGGYRAYLSGNFTRFYQTGDVICLSLETIQLNGGGAIDSSETYLTISKVL